MSNPISAGGQPLSQRSIQWWYRRKMWSLRLILCLAFSVPSFALAQSADEMALRALAEKFFAAYQQQAVDGLMSLWSEKAPDFASSQQGFQQTFAANKVEL